VRLEPAPERARNGLLDLLHFKQQFACYNFERMSLDQNHPDQPDDGTKKSRRRFLRDLSYAAQGLAVGSAITGVGIAAKKLWDHAKESKQKNAERNTPLKLDIDPAAGPLLAKCGVTVDDTGFKIERGAQPLQKEPELPLLRLISFQNAVLVEVHEGGDLRKRFENDTEVSILIDWLDGSRLIFYFGNEKGSCRYSHLFIPADFLKDSPKLVVPPRGR